MKKLEEIYKYIPFNIFAKTQKNIQIIRSKYSTAFIFFVVFNLLFVVFQCVYLALRYKYLNTLIPFWYTKPWGDLQLVPKDKIVFIPLFSILFFLTGMLLIQQIKKHYLRYSEEVLIIFVCISNFFLTSSLVKIINAASTPFLPIINPYYAQLILPFLASFLLVLVLTPKFIDYAKDRNLVTNPTIHDHPGMALSKPSARGGGVVFTVGLLLTALFFIPLSREFLGIYIVVSLLALLGVLDDFQNTHPISKFRILEKPILRLLILFFVVSLIVFFRITTAFIGNPFGGVINFAAYKISFASFMFAPIPTLFTVVWIVWVLNVLSWSNGIDGQYGGIVGIAAVVTALLALRFSNVEQIHLEIAKLAIITAGACFGLVYYTWHPSRIMWGFGAMTAAFILSSLSILSSSKIATSIMIILIPFLDALVTVIRRILQKKNPLKGDRGHLHHLLLERGWSVEQIAIFYWVTTATFGAIALASSEKFIALVTLTLAGIVAFFIILLNLISIAKKQELQAVE